LASASVKDKDGGSIESRRPDAVNDYVQVEKSPYSSVHPFCLAIRSWALFLWQAKQIDILVFHPGPTIAKFLDNAFQSG
jgi:hypothetical protein